MRIALMLLSATLPMVPGRADLQSEYKQADTNYYLGSDLFHADPAACIVTPAEVTNMGGSYLVDTRTQAPQVIYLQETHDWLEPITPPNMPASLNCPSTQMQVREPQGSVQVALPSAPADFREVKGGMTIPNGSVLRTGDNSSVAVLFGGVDSVRLAPDTRGAVQMNLVGGVRDVEVDTRSGMVFSKVGQRMGEREVYAVHTPFGIASAHGTDYVTVVLPRRVDVWIAQGTVELASPDGGRQVTVSTGHEPLKIMRYPVASDPAVANTESAESLTALLNFIPMANQKLKALADRAQDGERLTATEKDYMGRIRKVTSLIRLATADAPITPVPARAKVAVAASPKPAKPIVAVALNHPKAKPAAPAPAPSSAPAKAVALTTPATAHPAGKPPVASTVSSEPAVAAANATDQKMKKVAQAAKKPKHAKPVVLANAASDNLAPPPDQNYPRAKPVDPADLVAAPAVMSTPPPARTPIAPLVTTAASPASGDSIDPSSLGAQLSPFDGGALVAPISNRSANANLEGTQPGASSSLGGVTRKANETSP